MPRSAQPLEAVEVMVKLKKRKFSVDGLETTKLVLSKAVKDRATIPFPLYLESTSGFSSL